MKQKQILIVQDLGVDPQVVNSLAEQYQLKHQLIYPGEAYEADQVEGLITINKKLDDTDLQAFTSLQFIAVAFTGYDSVPLTYCKEKGIAIYNVPTYATDSVAELTLGTTLAMLREIHVGNTVLRNGQWDLGRAGVELAGKKVGIVGTGRIGQRVAELFKAFACEVLAWSRSEREEFLALGSYESDIKELCAKVDILCLHVPLNEDTKALIGAEELSAMHADAYLVNMARGPVVDQAALVEALEKKQIAGAAIDVFDQEPIDASHPYCALDNALLTPHIAYKTNEALVRRAAITFGNIQNYLQGNSVNRVL